jgi:hypothetical protein
MTQSDLLRRWPRAGSIDERIHGLCEMQELEMHNAVFTPNNAAMLLIDHQIGTMAWTHSHDITSSSRMR